MDIAELKTLTETKLASQGFELFDIKLVRAGSRLIVRVFIDREVPVTIDDCGRVSQELSMMLDVENFSSHPYTLEVSTPGIDRPLLTERDYRRCAGRHIRTELHEPVNAKKGFIGKVLGCDNGMLSVDIDGAEVIVPLSNIVRAKIEITFK